MKIRNSLPATIYALALGWFGLGALVILTDWRALQANALPLAVFAALSFILKRAGFHAAPEVTHSLVGIVDLAAVFIFGPLPGAWVAATSGFFYLFLNAWRRDKHTIRELVEIPIFNAGLKIGMAYASSHLYLMFGGRFAPREFTLATIPAVVTAGLAWFVIDHIGWGLLEFLRGGAQALANFVRSILLYSVFVELLPLPFAIVIAVVYSTLSLEMFLMISLGLVGTSIVVQRFADASLHLERRRTEVAVMNEFGYALSRAVFDSEKVIDLLYEHARRIVPADLYRIELVQGEHDPKAGLVALEATANETRHPYETRPCAVLEYFSSSHDPVRAMRPASLRRLATRRGSAAIHPAAPSSSRCSPAMILSASCRSSPRGPVCTSRFTSTISRRCVIRRRSPSRTRGSTPSSGNAPRNLPPSARSAGRSPRSWIWTNCCRE